MRNGTMKTMKRTQGICVAVGIAVTSLVALPSIAGADTTCYTGCKPPTVSPSAVTVSPKTTDPVRTAAVATTTSNGSSSLPFTGADVGELAAVGLGAVVIGGVLTRRRRTS